MASLAMYESMTKLRELKAARTHTQQSAEIAFQKAPFALGNLLYLSLLDRSFLHFLSVDQVGSAGRADKPVEREEARPLPPVNVNVISTPEP
jgi:hypothetical protein